MSSPPGSEPTDAVASREIMREVSLETARERARELGQSYARRHLTWPDMRRIISGALQDCLTDRVSLAAAGSAFYGTLALFPAISVLISVYGLVFDPAGVEPQLHLLAGLVPAPAFLLIEDRVHELIHQPPTSLSVGLAGQLPGHDGRRQSRARRPAARHCCPPSTLPTTCRSSGASCIFRPWAWS